MKTLDLCNMSAELTKELNDIAEKSRRSYTELVDNLSDRYAENPNWWITPFVSRETSQCTAFRDYCIARLAINRINTGMYDRVIVSEKSLYDTIKLNSYNSNVDIKLREQRSSIIRRKLSILYNIYNIIKLYKRIDIVKRNSSIIDLKKLNNRIILIDTYMILSQFINGKYVDRYFPGLMENTDENIIFIAQLEFSCLKDGGVLARNVNRLNKVIMFEQYVQALDFKEVIKYSITSRKFNFEKCCIEGMDIHPIVNATLKQGASNITAMYGILKGNVVCRLINDYKLDVKKLVGWYEGQSSSNGMFYKFRKSNDKISTIAYVYSPCPENNLGLYPSKMQRKNKAVAKVYAISGVAWIDSVKQFDEKTECILAPSFRHGNIFQKKIENDRLKNTNSVLVVLSGVMKVASLQLHAFLESIVRLPDLQVFIKNHPFYENFKMTDYGISETEYQHVKYEFVHGKLDELLEDVKLAIVSETSSCLEIVTKGVSVIVFIPAGHLSFNCMPIEYRELIHAAYTVQDMRNILIEIQNKKLEVVQLEELQSKAFIAINREQINAFLKEEVNKPI